MTRKFTEEELRQIADAKATCRTKFLRLLSKGKPVPYEEAIEGVPTPEGYDRRGLGCIVTELVRDGHIVRVEYRPSSKHSHHFATKSVWRLKGSEVA